MARQTSKESLEQNGVLKLTRQVCNFFNYMAFELDIESVKPMTDDTDSDLPLRGSNFDPMRRKMLVVQM